MGVLDGRVAIVTGAGSGLGRSHARLFAGQGARVVVNDVSGEQDRVVEEIVAAGGEAVAVQADVADWDQARALVDEAVQTYGDLHVLVNNAGVFSKCHLPLIEYEEWEQALRVNVTGHLAPLRHAAAFWRARSLAGVATNAAVINATSGAGLHGNAQEAAYGASKAAIAALTLIAAKELHRYGVRVNDVGAGARTAMAGQAGVLHLMRIERGEFDRWDPDNVSPLLVHLARADCEITGQVFRLIGGALAVYRGWSDGASRDIGRRWSIDELWEAVPQLVAEGSPADVDPGYQASRAAIDDVLRGEIEATGRLHD